MTDNEVLSKALNRAYFFLKFRPRTRKELEDYLQKKAKRLKLTEAQIIKTLSKLKEQGFIDDKAFIEWYVNQRSRLKPKSRFLLGRELFKLGISREQADSYFEKHTVDEDRLASRALAPRWSRLKQLSWEKRFQRASSFLRLRGFGYEVIKKTIAEFEKKE